MFEEASEFKGWHSRGYVQHRDEPGARQFLTTRLADSLPAAILNGLSAVEESDEESPFAHEAALDAGHGACWLRRPEIAEIVIENLHHWDGTRYQLGDYVMMPNHYHVDLVQVMPLRAIMQGKGYTAWRANRVLGRQGKPFWHPDYYDQVVRDQRHWDAVKRYIWLNPVRAGLCEDPFDWAYSSIHRLSETERDRVRWWFEKWQRTSLRPDKRSPDAA